MFGAKTWNKILVTLGQYSGSDLGQNTRKNINYRFSIVSHKTLYNNRRNVSSQNCYAGSTHVLALNIAHLASIGGTPSTGDSVDSVDC
jgi:hypothetical protein